MNGNDLIDISSFESFKKDQDISQYVTHYEVIKLFNSYLAIYIRPYSIALYHILIEPWCCTVLY